MGFRRSVGEENLCTKTVQLRAKGILEFGASNLGSRALTISK